MPFDDDLTAGLAALAARVHPNPGDSEGLLRLHAVQQRRRVAARGGALMAVTATGAVLTLPHLGGSGGRAGLAIGTTPTPMVSAASHCPAAPDPTPTPLALTPSPSTTDGPQATPAPSTPPPSPADRSTAGITKAIDVTTPVGVTRACDLGSDLRYRAGSTQGPIIDVAAATWTGPLPALDAGSRVVRRYADGDEYRSTVTAKGVKVSLWSGGDLITWVVEPTSATSGARVEDLEGWADRVHAALN
jgi:hypothetical protein